MSNNELIIIPKIEKYIEYMLTILFKLPRTEKFSIGTEVKTSVKVNTKLIKKFKIKLIEKFNIDSMAKMVNVSILAIYFLTIFYSTFHFLYFSF